jgi:hypothetical protein
MVEKLYPEVAPGTVVPVENPKVLSERALVQIMMNSVADYRQRTLYLDDALTHLENFVKKHGSLWERFQKFAWLNRRLKAAHGQAKKARFNI